MYVTIRIYHHFTTCFEQNRLNWSICFVREHIAHDLKLDTGHLLFSDYDSSFFVLNQIGRNYDVQNMFQHVPAMFNKFSICICWPICVQESPHVTTKKISMSILHSELNPVDIQDTWHWPSTDFNWHWPTVMIKATATWYWPSRLQDNSWFIIPAVEPTSFHWIHPNSPAQALLRLLQYVAVATFQTYDILYYCTLW